jgi:hypothetical protein
VAGSTVLEAVLDVHLVQPDVVTEDTALSPTPLSHRTSGPGSQPEST